MTDEQRALIRRLWKHRSHGKPMPAYRIAELVGGNVSPQLVVVEARRMGLPPRSGDFGRQLLWSEEETRTLLECMKNNLGAREIAKVMKMTVSQIRKKAQRLDVKFYRPPPTGVPAKQRERVARVKGEKVRSYDGEPLAKPTSLPKDLRVVHTSPTLHKPFYALEKGECRWPMDDAMAEGTADTLFCAHPATGNYCDKHQRLVGPVGAVKPLDYKSIKRYVR